jgi:hypothetical protein
MPAIFNSRTCGKIAATFKVAAILPTIVINKKRTK